MDTVRGPKRPRTAPPVDSLRRDTTQHDSTLLLGACGDFQFGADVQRNLGRIIINEMADAVVGDAAKFGPFAQGADGGFTTGGENTAGAKTDDVGELGVDLRTDAGKCAANPFKSETIRLSWHVEMWPWSNSWAFAWV